MKTMTCNQLGGACDMQLHADTFDDMAKISKAHGTEMFENKDSAHMEAMGKMGDLMKNPQALQDWMENKRKEFDALPEN